MRHLVVSLLLSTFSTCTLAQTTSQPTATSDAQAVSLAQQSIAGLTGGVSVNDVTLDANVISILGSGNDPGTGTFRSKGASESRVDLNLASGNRSDARNTTNGFPSGAWATNGKPVVAYAQHNCWIDASWFFPALSSLAQTGNNFIFRYIGQEQHRGVSTQHIQVSQSLASFQLAQQLSTMDFYLDAETLLPLAMTFNSHADQDMNVNIPSEILFASYQNINGVRVPFHVQKLLNGSLVLDVTVTSVAFNTGLLDSSFILQ
jgi:hypothetical protein